MPPFLRDSLRLPKVLEQGAATIGRDPRQLERSLATNRFASGGVLLSPWVRGGPGEQRWDSAGISVAISRALTAGRVPRWSGMRIPPSAMSPPRGRCLSTVSCVTSLRTIRPCSRGWPPLELAKPGSLRRLVAGLIYLRTRFLGRRVMRACYRLATFVHSIEWCVSFWKHRF